MVPLALASGTSLLFLALPFGIVIVLPRNVTTCASLLDIFGLGNLMFVGSAGILWRWCVFKGS